MGVNYAFGSNCQKNIFKNTLYFRAKYALKETEYFIKLLGGAPLCILAFRHKPDYSKTDNSITQSIAAAIQNMLLMAYSKGIGSCWLTAPLEVGTDKLLKERYAKDKGDMVAIMTFGYPDQIANMPKRKEGRYTII